ncbi:hypothetical protein PSPO01_06769 [Paraphaeosphaeria sporulosa]
MFRATPSTRPKNGDFFQASCCPTEDSALRTLTRGSATSADVVPPDFTHIYFRAVDFRAWLRIFVFPVVSDKTVQERAGILLAV